MRRLLHSAGSTWPATAGLNHEQPLQSYLETGQGERIAAHEIMESWHLQAELVTLSACQTGVSRVLRGDEPMGLIRAFLYAGAKAVLVTQWPVEDLATCLLMVRFYQELANKNSALSAALGSAQQWLRELTVSQARWALDALPVAVPASALFADLPADARPFAEPRHWAAFMVVQGR